MQFFTPTEVLTLLLYKNKNPTKMLKAITDAIKEIDVIIGNKIKAGFKTEQAKWVTRELLERYAWDIPVSEDSKQQDFFYCIQNFDKQGYIIGGTNKFLCEICRKALNMKLLNWKLHAVSHGMVWKYRYPGCISCKTVLWSPRKIKDCFKCVKQFGFHKELIKAKEYFIHF